jgi:hypothetical protein
MCIIVWLQKSGEIAVKKTDNEPSGEKNGGMHFRRENWPQVP